MFVSVIVKYLLQSKKKISLRTERKKIARQSKDIIIGKVLDYILTSSPSAEKVKKRLTKSTTNKQAKKGSKDIFTFGYKTH